MIGAIVVIASGIGTARDGELEDTWPRAGRHLEQIDQNLESLLGIRHVVSRRSRPGPTWRTVVDLD
jgi:hypothetical protein